MPQTGFGSVTNSTYSGGQRIFTGRVKFILLNEGAALIATGN